jgi:hypothetical protein
MPQVKSNKNLKRDKKYDKIDILTLPGDLLNSIREITLADDSDLQDFVNSAIAGREVTNEVDDLREWRDKYLAKNVVKVAETDEEYYEIVHAALLSLPNQYQKGMGKQKRGPIQLVAQKVGGYLVEFAVHKWARKIGVEVRLAHEIGRLEEFLDSDFPDVLENGAWRKSKINVGAKSGRKNAVWLDVPEPQFSNTYAQIFGRTITDGNHLDNDALENLLKYNPYLAKKEWPDYFLDYRSKLTRNPISVYLAGFAQKPENKGFTYDGYAGSKIFHVTEMAGLVPTNWKDVVRKKSELPADFKIDVLAIEKFGRHDNGNLYVWNSGSIIKTSDQIDELIRKL